MKKLLLLTAVIALTASCKKNRTCSCTYQETGPFPETYTTTLTIKDTKKNAKEWCEGRSSSGSGSGYSWSQTCELK